MTRINLAAPQPSEYSRVHGALMFEVRDEPEGYGPLLALVSVKQGIIGQYRRKVGAWSGSFDVLFIEATTMKGKGKEPRVFEITHGNDTP